MRNKCLRRALLVASFTTVLTISVGPAPIAAAEATVELSKETTFITSPLAADGLPDYAKAISERQSTSVTPENNGARLLWQAMGPYGVDDADFKLICDVLQLDPNDCLQPYEGPRSEAFAEHVANWLRTADPSLNPASARAMALQAAVAMQQGSLSVLSTTPAAEWIEASSRRLDLIVAASELPRFFSPQPELLRENYGPIAYANHPHVELLRSASTALAFRAHYRLARQEYEKAWHDILAMRRLAEFAGQGWGLVDEITEIAIRESAMSVTHSLIESSQITPQMLQQVKADVRRLDGDLAIDETLNFGERCCALDYSARFLTGRMGGLPSRDADDLSNFLDFSCNASDSLRTVNLWCDQIVSAYREQDRLQRARRLNDLMANLISTSKQSVRDVHSTNKPNDAAKSKAAGDALSRMLLESLKVGALSDDRANARRQLLSAAIELRIYRDRHGAYPASLSELNGGVRSKFDDPYSEAELIYLVTPDGYVLYSVFENGADDGGDDCSGRIIDGEWQVPQDPNVTEPEVPYSDSDCVIRSPIKQYAFPLPDEER